MSSANNQLAFYLNARKISTQTRSIPRLTGGGTLIFGQDQDAEDAGGLDANQALT